LTRVRELAGDAVLDADIQPIENSSKSTDERDDVLLTGSTGFLGTFLLRGKKFLSRDVLICSDLLESSKSVKVHCLVRCKDVSDGMKRIRESMEKHKLWKEEYHDRIQIVVGDLSSPRFSLTENQFNELAAKISVVYHCGALVNHLQPYSYHKAPNVNGMISTKSILIPTKSLRHQMGHKILCDDEIQRIELHLFNQCFHYERKVQNF
jgi:hypothetical protein